MSTAILKSGIYQGRVRHRRFQPKGHEFEYSVFMMYLDLSELDTVFSLNWLWSINKESINNGSKNNWFIRNWCLARYSRNDYFGDASVPLDVAIKQLVENKIGRPVNGAVRMLTNLRYFGFIINPITIYYCFDENEQLQAMVLEVTNTPWEERVQYILDCDPAKKTQRTTFSKDMHVSPFHPMSHFYDWASNTPNENIAVHMKNREIENHENVVFDATLSLKRSEITKKSLTKILLKYPFMTMKVGLSIYWQALKVISKGVPVHSHPKDKNET